MAKITSKHYAWALGAGLALAGALLSFSPSVKPAAAHPVEKALTLPALAASAPAQGLWRQELTQAGDTYAEVLGRMNVPASQIEDFIQHNPLERELRQFKPNQAFTIHLDAQGQMDAVQYFSDDDDGERNLVALEKKDGKWRSGADEQEAKTLPSLREVVVRTSARGALAQAEIPVQVRETINDLFSKDFSLNDLTPGDSIRLYYDNHYYRGQIVGTGTLHAVQIHHAGKLHQAFYFGDEEKGAFYDETGKPMKDGFTLKPVGEARITSPFGMRFHPVLGTWRMHTGIDYASPSGTPIHAPATGVVIESGPKGGYGNAILLRHANGMVTLYGHMSAYASGLGVGAPVSPGQVIGYVGMTGRATGPHLHYEVRINNEPVNPATVALPAQTLTATERSQFAASRAGALKILNLLPEADTTVTQIN